MSDQMEPLPGSDHQQIAKSIPSPSDHLRRKLAVKSFLLLVIISISAGGGILIGRQMGHEFDKDEALLPQVNGMDLMHQVNPPDGYTIPAVFGDSGPKMVAAGAIDLARFIDLYKQQDKPLSDDQLAILTSESDSKILITPQNAYFLLNFFWAYGLSNENPILTAGQMVSGGLENVGGFASVGGWSLGEKEPTRLYASTKMVTLSDEQQARLVEVASAVYRPCCNNPTHFPDCNHGMAMLGLLELMASQGATLDEMFETAKFVNAFWYPQQMLEVAIAYKTAKNMDFPAVDARAAVSKENFSGSGFQLLHSWLSQNGLLEQAPGSGGSCGVR